MNSDFQTNIDRVNRRQFFGRAAHGIGGAALASLLAGKGTAAETLPGLPHFAPKAKRVVCLWQGGGCSHVDLFDPKPTLTKMQGQDIPASVRGTTRLSTMTSGASRWPMVGAIKPFQKYGQCGMELSSMLPNLGKLADDICLVRSMHTEAVNHAPGVTFFMTGSQIPGRPSLGSWLTYGLGCESEELPAYVVMTSSDKAKTCGQLFFDYYWGAGFLPSRFQGVRLRNTGDPVPFLESPAGTTHASRRALLDDIRALNEEHLADYGDPEIDTRISQYEMAYRMQTSVPDLMDFSKEPKSVIERYGPDALVKGTFANNCLIARRLLERGVRFVQLMHAGWDQHGNLFTQLEVQCRDTEQPAAALIADLKERGLLDDTLVYWGNEFGRTPFGQGDPAKPNGRDHFGRAYSVFLAGGGVRGGTVYGETDEFAWNIVRDPVHVHDMQATILHLCGINHEAFTFRFQGRQFRLTDVHGHPVKGIIA
jgi:hypothetical protein